MLHDLDDLRDDVDAIGNEYERFLRIQRVALFERGRISR